MSSFRIPIEFLNPAWLFVLIGLPLIWLCFRRSLAALSNSAKTVLLILRMLTFCCVVLAAATPNYLTQNSTVFPIFVIDDSGSIDDVAARVANKFLATATRGKSAEEYAVIKTSQVGFHSTGSNLQQAVQRAAAMVPEGLVGHAVLLTDGLETEGSLASIAAEHTISTVPLPASQRPEMQVSAVLALDIVDVGETFSISAELTSNVLSTAKVDLFADQFLVDSKSVELVQGSNIVDFRHALKESSVLTVRLTPTVASELSASTDQTSLDLIASVDTNLTNNTAGKIVTVDGPTRVLLIDAEVDSLRDLKFALQQQQIEVEIVPPAGWPQNMAQLQKYDTVILSDVPASAASTSQMQLMKTWVRDFGGGLVMLGGENSFGLGGYYGTAIEDILPVTCDFQEKEEEPGLAMMMVMDKSDSMTGQKIESARQAAAAAVELLTERDQIGVVAFDGSAFWVSDLVSASQQAQVVDRIARIQPGGGTNLYPALQEAFGRLKAASSKLKHVLILTDGYSVPGDFEGIVQDMAALKITVSTIGLGAADNELLRKLAEIGRGRHYECKDATELPQIFARETMRVNQPAVKEDAVLVEQVRASRAVADIDFETAPFLLGYVVTSARPTSEVILVEPESLDPILCWWKFGLGTTVAFTSDATNRWAAEWLQWEDYSQFWAQLIRSSRPTVSNESMVLDIQRSGRKLTVTIDEVSPQDRASSAALYSIAVVDPDQNVINVNVVAVAAGMYQAIFDAGDPGVYSIQARKDSRSGDVLNLVSRSVMMGYDDELKVLPTNTLLLQSVAAASGGQFEVPAEQVFEPIPGKSASASWALTSILLLAAMMIYVVDLVIRRVVLSAV
ncbi:MAG: VWA domain-containing protein [Fuerstiella sp.]